MPTITLDVSDELAAQLAQRRKQLPQLLSMALELLPAHSTLTPLAFQSNQPVFEEMIAFLASGPSPEQIASFKISPASQARLDTLLDKNREEGLTEEETAELDVYAQVNHLLTLLKARARVAPSPSQ